MSRTPYFFVERPDRNTGKYEMQHPIVWNYNHTKQEPADLFPYNECHDLFSIVENNGTGNVFPTMRGIHCGLPKNVAAEIKEAYDHFYYETGYSGEKHLYIFILRLRVGLLMQICIFIVLNIQKQQIMKLWMKLIIMEKKRIRKL